MKLNREQITEFLGSAPDEKDGKKLTGIEYGPLAKGCTYYNSSLGSWQVHPHNYDDAYFPVAIFEDTHRADGTPTSIAELPEIEGYRLKYVKDSREIEIGEKVMCCSVGEDLWREITILGSGRNQKHHYARLFKIAKPTTLKDLVGKQGQNMVWLIGEHGSRRMVPVSVENSGALTVGDSSVTYRSNFKTKWSNSPFTAYADANPFTI